MPVRTVPPRVRMTFLSSRMLMDEQRMRHEDRGGSDGELGGTATWTAIEPTMVKYVMQLPESIDLSRGSTAMSTLTVVVER